jgi:hypothetical protein
MGMTLLPSFQELGDLSETLGGFHSHGGVENPVKMDENG